MKNKPINIPPLVEQSVAMDLPPVDSVALQRLINEVRPTEIDGQVDMTLYNRTYHRHNR